MRQQPAVGKSGPVIEPSPFRDAHQQSDVNSSKDAQHHTLGKGPNEAYPGNAFTADFNAAFPAAFLGQISAAPLVFSNFVALGGYGIPILAKIGPLVFIRGVFSNASGSPQNVICTAGQIPAGYLPGAQAGFPANNNGGMNHCNVTSSGLVSLSGTVPNGGYAIINGFWLTGY